jgi:5-methylcytosine-specific restriction endonuclease McrA
VNADKTVWVELYPDQRLGADVRRIFRSKAAALSSGACIWYMRRSDAVGAIRHAIFVRSGGDCELCSSPVTEDSGHMHERQWRSRGGEISLENSIFICAHCHQNAHKERDTRWTKKNRSGERNEAI